ncbi:MAG: Coenzyme F420 hydrogenase/dehydrogenase, beta subunit C-terminal domain [Clostridia bacterium]|nr:Coenzyme F420 hydrogenase/dehydrogenase, beta subunit C-terminal domain [Clostridia bacterium]
MIDLYDKKQGCCGCTACENICPVIAINMVDDEEGFKYPEVDDSKCISCGLCKAVCKFKPEAEELTKKVPLVYAVKHKNEDVRFKSTSGGVFTALSDSILGKGGVVYGVAFDENFVAVHKRATTREQRDEFMGSKYVQSFLGSTFSGVKNDLESGRTVLFTGTPCQCDGLMSYLKKKKVDCGKLYVVDIVCHGVPSPLMWKEHIESCEKKRKAKIEEYLCRSKINGWHTHTELIVYDNEKKDCTSALSQKQKILFYSHKILRPACHRCRYTSIYRCSDITMADFWGIENSMPEFDDNKGVSLVLVSSDKGEKLFEEIKEQIVFEKSHIEDCLQPQLKEPSKPAAKRTKFWEDYRKRGYWYIATRYGGCGLRGKIIRFLAGIKTLKKVKKFIGK